MSSKNIYTCNICFYTIRSSQLKTLKCVGEHKFHMKCIWLWIVKNNSCPLCRCIVSKYPEANCQHNEYIHFVNAVIKNVKKEL
jgi:hypothetical protein